MSNIKPETFENVRRLVEAKTVPCLHTWGAAGGSKDCPDCDGALVRLDPTYAPLLALSREKCQRCDGQGDAPPFRYACNWCRDTSYVSRLSYWQAAPKGALRGSLEDAMPEPWILSVHHGWAEVGQPDAPDALVKVEVIDGNTDQAAFEAVEAWAL